MDFFAEESAAAAAAAATASSSEDVKLIAGVPVNLRHALTSTSCSTISNLPLRLADVTVLFENFEIYNEDIYDLQAVQEQKGNYQVSLMSSEPRASKHNHSTSKSKLKLKELHNKKVHIKGTS